MKTHFMSVRSVYLILMLLWANTSKPMAPAAVTTQLMTRLAT